MVVYFILGYIALYSVIWLHEVGHGMVYAKYKCKDNPFDVHVPLYLFFSTPNPVNREKASKILSHRQISYVGMGGIAVNIIFGIPSFILLVYLNFPESIFYYFLFSFSLFHLVEAAAYLVISNIFLSSDMLLVHQYKPILRIPLFIIGLVIIGLISFMIMNGPESWRLSFVIAIFLMTACMVIGRIIFTKLQTAKA